MGSPGTTAHSTAATPAFIPGGTRTRARHTVTYSASISFETKRAKDGRKIFNGGRLSNDGCGARRSAEPVVAGPVRDRCAGRLRSDRDDLRRADQSGVAAGGPRS